MLSLTNQNLSLVHDGTLRVDRSLNVEAMPKHVSTWAHNLRPFGDTAVDNPGNTRVAVARKWGLDKAQNSRLSIRYNLLSYFTFYRNKEMKQ